MQGIPRKFVKKLGDDLSTVASLTLPNGRVWKIELSKDGKKIWFHDGWQDFVEYHSITTGHFLVFRYEKNSNFHVLIFDMSACEIRYPHYRVGLNNDKQEDAIEDEDSDESDSDENEDEVLAILEEMGICVNKNFRNITAKEKGRVVAAARLFRPKNPSFMAILRPRNLCYDLYVPFQFKKYLMGRNLEMVKLQDRDGREWPVKVNCSRWQWGGAEMSRGWRAFAKDMNLKNGDICMFELIEEKDIVLKSFNI